MLNKITVTLAGAFLIGQAAHAHHVPNKLDIAKLAEQSKLVFHGKVIDIAYRGSQATKHQESLPHTFVTYQVDEVLHGNLHRKTIQSKSLLDNRPLPELLNEAERQGIISAEEAATVTQAEQARQQAIRVDDFDQEQLVAANKLSK